MLLQKSQRGFTLIEVLIAMSISVVIVTAIYELFYTQQRSYITQNQVAEMQQNLRAGIQLMVQDIRSAGYDPRRSRNFGFVTDFASDILPSNINYTSQTDIIAFTIDDDENGRVALANDGVTPILNRNSEQFIYRFNNTAKSIERYNFDPNGSQPPGWNTIATNVDALNFVYLDRNGNVTTNLADFRAVEVSIVVRTGKPDKRYYNTQVYKNKQGQDICPWCNSTAYLRQFRRRLVSTTVQARNL